MSGRGHGNGLPEYVETRTGYVAYDEHRFDGGAPQAYPVPPPTAAAGPPGAPNELAYAGYAVSFHPLQQKSRRWRNMAFASMGLCIVGLVLIGASIGTNYWSSAPINWSVLTCEYEGKFHLGLIKACATFNVKCTGEPSFTDDECYERENYCDIDISGNQNASITGGIDNGPYCDRTRAAVSMLAIAILLLVVGCVVSGLAGCGSKGAQIAGASIYSVASVCIITAIALWVENNQELDNGAHPLLAAFSPPKDTTQAQFVDAIRTVNVSVAWSFGLSVLALVIILCSAAMHIVAACKMQSASNDYTVLGSPVVLQPML